MERTVLNGPVDATSSFHPSQSTANGAPTTSWKRQLLLLARLLFLGSALGVLVWRLVADGGGALDAARRIGLATLLGSFLAASGSRKSAAYEPRPESRNRAMLNIFARASVSRFVEPVGGWLVTVTQRMLRARRGAWDREAL